MKLEALEVEGLLSFGERTKFEFGNLNVLVGANGSGKSNLFSLLSLLKALTTERFPSSFAGGYEQWIYKGEKSKGIEMVAHLKGRGSNFQHTLQLDGDVPVLTREALWADRLQPEVIEKDALEIKFGRTLDAHSFRSYPLPSLVTYRSLGDLCSSLATYPEQIPSPDEDPILLVRDFYKDISTYSVWEFGPKSNLRQRSSTDHAVDRLSESLDNFAYMAEKLLRMPSGDTATKMLKELNPNFSEFFTQTRAGGIELFVRESNLNSETLASRLSDGTLRFLAFATILLAKEPASVICIEEPEMGMHPDMLDLLADMLNEAAKKSQVFVTTHSPYFLTSVQNGVDRLISMRSTPIGSAVDIYDRERLAKFAHEETLGCLWTAGQIGGVRY